MNMISANEQVIAARGRPGGDESRARMIAAAARMFAERSFDGVSVREIAQAADVNVSAVSYHFGGKRGLYIAALEQLLEEMRPVGGPVIERIEGILGDKQPGRNEIKATAVFTVRHILTAMLSGDLEPWVTQTVLREFQSPTTDYRPMLDERVLPLHKAVGKLTAASLGTDANAPATVLAAHGVMGQIMVFAAARRVVQEELGWREINADQLESIIEAATSGVLGALGLQPNPEAC
jgi:AcrR family transcriptional regulator